MENCFTIEWVAVALYMMYCVSEPDWIADFARKKQLDEKAQMLEVTDICKISIHLVFKREFVSLVSVCINNCLHEGHSVELS